MSTTMVSALTRAFRQQKMLAFTGQSRNWWPLENELVLCQTRSPPDLAGASIVETILDGRHPDRDGAARVDKAISG